MDAQTPPVITLDLLSRAISAEPLLRAIATPPEGGWSSTTELMETAGRDAKNATRDLARLEEIGFVARAEAKAMPTLTPLAVQALAAIERAAGGGETVSHGQVISALEVRILSWIDHLPKATATLVAMQIGLDRDGMVSLGYQLDKAGLLIDRTEGLSPCGQYHEPVYSLTDAGRAIIGAEAAPRHPTHAPHAVIAGNPNQPRKHFDEEALDELADSIRDHGQMQNIVVRPHPDPAQVAAGVYYQIVGGERRWRAVGRLIARGEATPYFPIRIEVRELTDEQVAVLALVENLQRQDLDFMERALGFKALNKDFGWSTAKIAEENRVSQKTVQLAITFAEATDAQVKAVRDGEKTYRQVLKEIALRPKPIELTPTQWMVIAEVLAAGSPTESIEYYRKAECDRDAAQAAIAELGLAHILEVTGPDYSTGHYKVGLKDGWSTFNPIMAQLPGLAPANRENALLVIRAKALGSDAAEAAAESGQWATPWLNGPFDLTEEGRARVAESEEAARQRASADAVRAAEIQLRRKALAENAERSASLIKRLTTFPVIAEDKREQVQTIMEAADAGLPWRFEPAAHYGHGRLLDRNGQPVDLQWADSADVRLQMIMATMNAAGGFAPVIAQAAEPEVSQADSQIPSTNVSAEDFDADREPTGAAEFWTWVGARLQRMYGVSAERAPALAQAAEARLEAEEVRYGDESMEWNLGDAVAIADDFAQDFPDQIEGSEQSDEAAAGATEDEDAFLEEDA